MNKRYLPLLVLASSLVFSMPAFASKSKPFKCQQEADGYLHKHYDLARHFYTKHHWKKAAEEFEKVIYFFPNTEEASVSSYYLGVCFFSIHEYDYANIAFSNYLKSCNQNVYFELAVDYKFAIAQHFKCGKKRRLFKNRYCPKIVTGRTLALTIYDEVIAALPNHEVAICALWEKADLLCQLENYKETIDVYQTIIRRFPKHEIIPDCYLKIAETYRKQGKFDFQNPDIIALAEVNARKFGEEYPRDERVQMAQRQVDLIRESYAKGLCDTGLFYARKQEISAAKIYFQSTIEEFPDTRVAGFCRKQLEEIRRAEEENNDQEPSSEIQTVLIEGERTYEVIETEFNEGNEIQSRSIIEDVVVLEEVEAVTVPTFPVGEDLPVVIDGPEVPFVIDGLDVPAIVAESDIPFVVESTESVTDESDTSVYPHYSLLKKRPMKYVDPQ